jgi:hypothetical protein
MAGGIIKKLWSDLKEIAQAAISNVADPIGRDGNLGLLLATITVLGAVFLTAVVYAPATILLMGLLYCEFRAMRTPAQNATYNQQEIDVLSNIEEKLKPIGFRLSKIYEEGSHLKRNSDGTFHRGSRLGVNLNAEVNELNALEEKLNARANLLRQAVLDRLDDWKWVVSLQFAFRLTAASYAVFCLFVYVLDSYRVGSFSQTSHSAFMRQYLMQVSGTHSGYGALAAALACAVILAFGYKAHRLWLEGSEQFSGAEASLDEDRDFGEWAATPKYEAGAAQVEPWYETLGVAPNASAREINAAWRKKMRKNHPDRVAELDPEFQTLAEDKSKRLNSAREEGLRRFED